MTLPACPMNLQRAGCLICNVLCVRRSAISLASGPETRITLTPPRPEGVAMAAMVSWSSARLVADTLVLCPRGLEGAALDAAIDQILLSHR